jgi:cephalosporin-C deacetylase
MHAEGITAYGVEKHDGKIRDRGGEPMNFIEKRIQELRNYQPDLTGKPDLEDFWERTFREFENKPFREEVTRVSSTLVDAEAYDISYEGFDETRIHGWFIVPRRRSEERLPCVTVFHGYPGGAGYPEDHARWLQAGFAVLALDVRGQLGRSGNRLAADGGQVKGFVTQNILDKERCYYRAMIVDALRGLAWVAGRPEIDPRRIAVAGGSQGGGLALAMGALSDIPCAIAADVPNLCHLDYAIFHSTGSLSEAAQYCSHYPEHLEQVLDTLSYFDMLNLAHRIKAPALLSVGLKDPICPPETIFPVFRRIASPVKDLKVYPFIGHAVMAAQHRLAVEFILEHTKPIFA